MKNKKYEKQEIKITIKNQKKKSKKNTKNKPK